MGKWEVNVELTIGTLTGQIAELEKLRDGKITVGKTYQRYKDCGAIVHKVSNDYGKAGYCSECWKEKGEKKQKVTWEPLIGATLKSFKLELDDFSMMQPRLTELVFEKAGKETVIKAAEIIHMIL